MSSRGIFILAITWIVMSPFWFWAENIALDIIWLCGGVIEVFGIDHTIPTVKENIGVSCS